MTVPYVCGMWWSRTTKARALQARPAPREHPEGVIRANIEKGMKPMPESTRPDHRSDNGLCASLGAQYTTIPMQTPALI